LATSILFGTQLGFLFFFIFSTWRLQYFLALSLIFFFSSSFQLGDFNTFWHSAWFSFLLHLFNLATSILFGTQLGFLFFFIFSRSCELPYDNSELSS
jgi:hypothetical protein